MRKARLFILAASLGLLSGGLFPVESDEGPYGALRLLADVWVSPLEQYIGASTCYPNCNNQARPVSFQVPYPDYIDITKIAYLCHGNGRSVDPCALDGMSYSVDTVRHVVNVTWTHRSDELWVRLAAPIKKAK